MSNPKFSAGDVVAAACCLYGALVVIPRTTVEKSEFLKPGDYRFVDGSTGTIVKGGWYYNVTDCLTQSFHESELRPYSEGDYTETSDQSQRVGQA